MRPKYALSEGNVKKKKHKKAINSQKKSLAGGVIPGEWGSRGSWNPVAEFMGGPPGRRRQREGVLLLKVII
jgi:hypothetical protein